MSSILWRLTLAQYLVKGSTVIWLTTLPSARIVEDPEEVRGIDAVHGGAEALAFGEDHDVLVGVLLGKAVDHVHFGADGPWETGSERQRWLFR